jgi:hypothetical protein
MYSLINRHAEVVVRSINDGSEYEWLIEKVTPPIPSDFRGRYRNFWSMNQSQLSPDFFETYFAALADAPSRPRQIDHIVASLYEASTRKNGQKSIQFSFATKLLHMTDQHLPVYDSQVAEFYFFQVPTGKSYEERLASLTSFYDFLKEEYARVLRDGLLKTSMQEFRREFPKNLLKLVLGLWPI